MKEFILVVQHQSKKLHHEAMNPLPLIIVKFQIVVKREIGRLLIVQII